MRTLSFEDFEPYRNATFRVADAAGYELRLAEVADHSNTQLEQFSLTFTCPTLPWLQQGTYSLLHPDIDEVVLFIVPIGPVGREMRYESVFSRFIDKTEMSAAI